MLVERVVVALARLGAHDARLLEQVRAYERAIHATLAVKRKLDPLSKSAAVIISQRFGIPESLEHRVCVHALVFETSADRRR